MMKDEFIQTLSLMPENDEVEFAISDEGILYLVIRKKCELCAEVELCDCKLCDNTKETVDLYELGNLMLQYSGIQN